LSEKHQTNAGAVTGAVPVVISVPHSSTQPAAVASDANISTLSLVSVGPYEEFAVSIMFCVCFFSSVDMLNIYVLSFMWSFWNGFVISCMDLFIH